MTKKNKGLREEVILYISKITGITFCQVAKIKHIGHEIEAITAGNQKWQGGRPNLINRPIINRIL